MPLLHCGGEGCHFFTDPQSTYTQLVNVPSAIERCGARLLVVPGDVAASYLINKLTGTGLCPLTYRMPLLGVPLPAEEIQTIADWICSGAPNN